MALRHLACDSIARKRKRASHRDANKQQLLLRLCPHVPKPGPKHPQEEIVRQVLSVTARLFHFETRECWKVTKLKKARNATTPRKILNAQHHKWKIELKTQKVECSVINKKIF